MSGDRRRIPEFYKLSVEERGRAVHERGLINTADFRALATGQHTLDLDSADKMIENVVGVMGLPLGLGMNLVVNEQQYIVPMVVEGSTIKTYSALYLWNQPADENNHTPAWDVFQIPSQGPR